MPKNLVIDPNFIRAPGKIQFTDIPVNVYNKTIEEEKAEIVEIPTRVSDANKAAEMLGKYYGLWTDKIDLDSKQEITFVDDLEEKDSEG